MSISSLFFGPIGKGVSKVAPILPPRPNDTSLKNIEVLVEDADVVMLLSEEFIYSYCGGPERGKYFFDYIQLSGDDAEAVAEVTRKIQALHDLRVTEKKTSKATLYETTMHDIEVLVTDKENVLNLVDSFLGGPEHGKYVYDYVVIKGESKANVDERVNKVQALHNLRAAEAHERAAAAIVKLNL